MLSSALSCSDEYELKICGDLVTRLDDHKVAQATISRLSISTRCPSRITRAVSVSIFGAKLPVRFQFATPEHIRGPRSE